MQRRLAWIAVCGTLALGVSPSTAQDRPALGHLVAAAPWSRLDVVLGRIQLVQSRLSQKATLRFDHPESGTHESLTFAADSPTTARLHYDYADHQQRLSVDIVHCDQVSLERQPQNASGLANVRFSQLSRGSLKLVVDAGHGPQEIVADTFWHLLLAEPDLCRTHLLPLLEGLRPGWRLEAKARQVEEALIAAARSASIPDSDHIAKLVQNLRAPDFQSRQVADRELREVGPTALPCLERLDERELDAEQRLRLKQIRQALAGGGEDTPTRVANRLACDPVVWLSLLERNDEAKRTLASQRLTLLAGKPISCDPGATAAERRQQANRLRAELGLDRPTQVGSRSDTTLRR